jgi:RNA polymerase sigma factor (sigma-70 family)
MPSDSQGEQRFFRTALALQGELRRVLFSYTHSDADAEDLLQDTYLRLLDVQPNEPMEEPSIRAFCLKTAHNLARDWLKHRKIVHFEPFDNEVHGNTPDQQPHTDQIINARQELLQVVGVLNNLSPKCGEVFTRRRIHGESIREIADELDISKNTVKFHLAKGDRRLRDRGSSSAPPSRNFLSVFRRRRRENP